MTAAVQIIFPSVPLGVQNALDTVAELRALNSADVTVNTEVLVAATGFYKYAPSSLAADDGSTVIKPDDLTTLQAGRWLAVTVGAPLTTFSQRTIGTGVPVARSLAAKGNELLTSADFSGSGAALTGVGTNALQTNTTGFGNTAVGYLAMAANTTGRSSVAVGDATLRYNTTGNYNVALGSGALTLNTIGYGNIGVGTNALNINTTGTNNVAMGTSAMSGNTTGNNNTAIGDAAMTGVAAGVDNVAIGSATLTTAGAKTGNTVVGTNAMAAATICSNNTAIGINAFSTMTTGNSNVGVGYWAGINVTTGGFNTLLGYNTGLGITTGSHNTIVGANVTGLSASLEGHIILADGNGNIRARHDGTNWTFAGSLIESGALDIAGGAAATTGGHVQIGATVQTTIGANGAASALTANPLGYLVAYIGATKVVIPYYNA